MVSFEQYWWVGVFFIVCLVWFFPVYKCCVLNFGVSDLCELHLIPLGHLRAIGSNVEEDAIHQKVINIWKYW